MGRRNVNEMTDAKVLPIGYAKIAGQIENRRIMEWTAPH